MKILVLVDDLHGAGGLERSLAYKVAAWAQAGHQLVVITLADRGPDFYALSKGTQRECLGIAYRRDVSLHSLGNLRQAARHFLGLRRALRKHRPDVVIHSGFGFDFFFLPLLASRRVFLVKENHSSRFSPIDAPQSFGARIKKRLRFWMETRYDAAVFLSHEEAGLSGLKNCVVIPNGMPEARHPLAGRKKQVIAAGRVCSVKGFDRLVQAWALAGPRLDGWQLLIFGDGEQGDIDSLRGLVAEHSLAHSVQLLPATPDILGHIAESSLFAMTSRSECFPMVLLEAMQLGVPVVAFDCPTGPRNIVIDGKTGSLVQDGDLAAFAETLVTLAMDSEAAARMGQNARLESSRYAMSRVAAQWTSLFDRVAK